MMSIKTFVICACLVIQNTGANQPDILSKRDNAEDPYANYYQAYDPNAAEVVQQPLQPFSEKQGFAYAMENVFGDDASLVLGTIGALMGTLAAVGVVLNNNNINSLSLDQDAICTTATAVGDLNIPNSAAVVGANDAATIQAALRTEVDRVTALINAINRPTRCQ